MSNRSKFSGGKRVREADEVSRLTAEERMLLTLYREMSERDRRYLRRVAEVIAATSG